MRYIVLVFEKFINMEGLMFRRILLEDGYGKENDRYRNIS